jgi:hypothetical protein
MVVESAAIVPIYSHTLVVFQSNSLVIGTFWCVLKGYRPSFAAENERLQARGTFCGASGSSGYGGEFAPSVACEHSGKRAAMTLCPKMKLGWANCAS